MKKFIFLAAAAATLATVPAAAEDVVVKIPYGDLDIASVAGGETLAGRIQAGVKQSCDRPDIRDLKSMLSWQECKDSAKAQAAEQLAAINATVTVLPAE